MTIIGTEAKAVNTMPAPNAYCAAQELAYEINTARLEVADAYREVVQGSSFTVHAVSMSQTMLQDHFGKFYAVAVVEYHVTI
ncbi:hypothetical protein [Kocuria massiliensis]|uniref:hypothetical protein n=1 Tax=Kocuria massiliensis TaxID=1926282 RepID=UPI0022B97149|nr:hypothetical protein [Kocuria massiliensis]